MMDGKLEARIKKLEDDMSEIQQAYLQLEKCINERTDYLAKLILEMQSALFVDRALRGTSEKNKGTMDLFFKRLEEVIDNKLEEKFNAKLGE